MKEKKYLFHISAKDNPSIAHLFHLSASIYLLLVMEPIYQDGQIVWVQPCQSLHPGEVGVFLYDGNGYLKVYGEQDAPSVEQCTPENGILGGEGAHFTKQPVLLSYNKQYEPILVLPEAVFRVAGRALN